MICSELDLINYWFILSHPCQQNSGGLKLSSQNCHGYSCIADP
jgi:hypothetical protein